MMHVEILRTGTVPSCLLNNVIKVLAYHQILSMKVLLLTNCSITSQYHLCTAQLAIVMKTVFKYS